MLREKPTNSLPLFHPSQPDLHESMLRPTPDVSMLGEKQANQDISLPLFHPSMPEMSLPDLHESMLRTPPDVSMLREELGNSMPPPKVALLRGLVKTFESTLRDFFEKQGKRKYL